MQSLLLSTQKSDITFLEEQSVKYEDGFDLPYCNYTFFVLGVEVAKFDYCDHQSYVIRNVRDSDQIRQVFGSYYQDCGLFPTELVPFLRKLCPSIDFSARFYGIYGATYGFSLHYGEKLLFRFDGLIVQAPDHIKIGSGVVHRDKKIIIPQASSNPSKEIDLSLAQSSAVWKKVVWALRAWITWEEFVLSNKNELDYLCALDHWTFGRSSVSSWKASRS